MLIWPSCCTLLCAPVQSTTRDLMSEDDGRTKKHKSEADEDRGGDGDTDDKRPPEVQDRTCNHFQTKIYRLTQCTI
jgi:hypothetical protein